MSKGFRRTSIEEKIDNSTNVNFGSFSENASLIQEDGPYLSTGNLSLRMDDFSHPLKSEPTFNNDLMVAEPSILSPSEDIKPSLPTLHQGRAISSTPELTFPVSKRRSRRDGAASLSSTDLGDSQYCKL